MIAAAKVGADLRQGQLREPAGQIHPDLPGQENAAVAAVGLQLPRVEAKITAYPLGNALHGRPRCFSQVLKVAGHRLHIQRFCLHPAQRLQLQQGAFQCPDSARETIGQPGQHIATDGKLPPLRLLLQQCQATRRLQQLQSDDQATT